MVDRVLIVSESSIAELPSPENMPTLPVPRSAPGYILYTSGSTGNPKGCMVSHAALASVSDSHATALQIKSNSRVFQFASYGFGMSLIDVFCTLAKGATVCIPSDSERSGDLVVAYNRMQVTWAIATPSLIKSIDPKDVPSLQTLVVAGEPLPRNLMSIWASQVQLVQAYGLTEWAGICCVTKPLSASASPANIGFTPNGRLWLADPNDPEQLVPVGAVGEMLLEGPCLADGYFKQDEQTATRFISPPSWRKIFAPPLASKKLYRTGDLMRYRPDGGCSYIGRTGTQVKIRGQRVELGEVEYHAGQKFGIDAKAVIAETLIPKNDDRPSLVVFVLPSTSGDSTPVDGPFLAPASDGFRTSVQAVSKALSSILPRYMLPDFYVPLVQIPLTVSRKTSRKQLRELGSERTRDELNVYQVTQKQCRPPTTPLERVLNGVFAAALNKDPSTIGIDDSFFQLGGDSIIAMRAIVLCRKQKVPLTIQEMFRYKSVAEIAKSRPSNDAAIESEAFEPFDLSPIQRAFMQATPNSHNDESQTFLVRLTNQADVETVRHAVTDLTKRHPILRTKYEKGETGKWRQCVQKHTPPTVFRADLISDNSDIPGLFSELKASLDIENGQVFATALTENDSGVRHLLLAAHYLVIDQNSWVPVCKSLDAGLQGISLTHEPSVSFRDWCKSQRRNATLMDPISLVPKDHGNSFSRDGISEVTVRVDKELTMTLVKKSDLAFGAFPVDVFSAALRHSSGKLSGDAPLPSFFLEIPQRGSADQDTTNTVGWLSSIVPIHFRLDEGASIVEITRRTKDARTSRGRILPNDESVESPLTVFLRFDSPSEIDTMHALEVDHSIEKDIATSPFPTLAMVDVMIVFCNDELKFVIRYHEKAISSSKMQQWMTQFELSLRDAASELSNLKPGLITGDLALPSISYDNLQEVIPCAPVQQGILLSQNRDPELYQVVSIWKAPLVESFESETVSNRFQDAWKQVLKRHSVLRTVMAERHADEGFDQVVLKAVVPNVEIIGQLQDDPIAIIRLRSNVQFKPEKPQHKLVICNAGDAVYVGLVISHALIDAQSISNIMRDLSLAYDGKLSAAQGPSYQKYISYLKNVDVDRSIDYWAEYLKDAVPCNLPSLDYHHSDVPQHRELKILEFDVDNIVDLQEFCAQQNITISNVFQLAWGLTLRCFLQTDDVSFGYLAAGRDIPLDDVQDAVGPYMNMMISRMKFDDDKTLKEQLQDILHGFFASSAHQHAPLGRIMSSLELSGPLFNTIISLRRPSSQMTENTSPLQLTNVWELDPTEVSIIKDILRCQLTVFPKYNLAANVHVSSTSMDVSMSYWTTVCSDEQAANFASTLQKALSTIMKQTDHTPSQLDLFSEQNFEQVQKINGTAPERVDRCAHHLIEQQVDTQPKAPAVCAWDGNFTYRELDDLASQWAGYLAHLGAGPETFVPVHLKKSKWAPVAMLAVIKTGAAFVMLDPSHPLDRMRDICTEVNASIIISSSDLAPLSEQLASSVVMIGGDYPSPQDSYEAPISSVLPSNALYAVFTSGSTGKPKGVVLEHSSFCSSTKAHGTVFKLNKLSRVLQFSSYAFDVSVAEHLSTLCYGGCICIPSDDERLNDLTSAINRMGVNTALLTASVLRLLDPEVVPSIRTVACTGEPLAEIDLEKWTEHAALINAYGPAEACIYCIIQANNKPHSDPRNVGHPAGIFYWIVDEHDHNRLAPVGSVGELVLEGPLVGRGYLNNPAKNAESFIQPPNWRSRFHIGVQGRFYKTGDLVRYGPNETLRYVGRRGTEVKINGQRLELSEVEHYLRQHVGQSIDVLVDVVHFSLPSGPPTLTAFFKPHSTKGVGAGVNVSMANLPSMIPSLKSRLRSSLPQYMVPIAYISMEEFPVGKTGKTDRVNLRELGATMRQYDMAAAQVKSKRPPRNDGERKIQKLVASVLNLPIESVGLDDNFFMLGGDSSYAIKLVSAARGEGLRLFVKDILVQVNLAGLVALEKDPEPVDEKPQATPSNGGSCGLLGVQDAEEFISKTIVPKSGSTADNIKDVLPTTDFQADIVRTWPYTYFLVSIHGPLDRVRLRAACQTVIERHEIYRTVYVARKSDILQVILKQIEVPFVESPCDNMEDLSSACEKACAPDLEKSLPLGEIHTRFNLFYQEDPNFHILAIRLSHAQYDGYCMPLLYKELSAIYEGTEPESVTNYSAYIHHLHEQGKSVGLQWWKHILSGCNTPTSLNSLSLGATDQQDHTLIELTREIELPSPPTKITVASLMKGAAALLLMRLTKTKDVVFGQVVSGRNCSLEGVENILGVCANIVPTRVNSKPKWHVVDLLQDVQAQQVDGLEYETLGLQEIQKTCTQWPEDTELGCLIQHQNLDLKPQFSLSEAQCMTRIFGGSFERKYLHICTLPRGNRMIVQVFAPSWLLSESNCQKVVDQLCDLTFWLAKNPYHLLSECDIPMSPNSEM
ncbi:unnamed protein product [Penicillium salamii]|uniref:Carrier domain-containing protein n=1 Tax=Penicillium salamii TaxID=1612424 RepID=A0A9W4JVX4_9EURO|nr:unnamed protein product [Penicillium salamii]